MRLDGDIAKGGSLANYQGATPGGGLMSRVPMLKGVTPFAASYLAYILASKLFLH